ncbi:MAG: NGG1p interacting factor NIF3 [Halobacteriovoraceae bacterium]|nr:NGG1p interacting factor NIF3 [Halobacteriovoraceae bacterium]MCB9094143.1 NGG1p interacting factor NIF3 [Halobacteriovoraceae bacterium]
MYLVYFYVPQEHKEAVKEAMFSAGAGKIGEYSHCSFEYSGVGQYLPLEDSRPFEGKKGEISKVQEVKVEMVCAKDRKNQVLEALKKSHPYEEPAYGFIAIES